jgi:hypothetical protein
MSAIPNCLKFECQPPGLKFKTSFGRCRLQAGRQTDRMIFLHRVYLSLVEKPASMKIEVQENKFYLLFYFFMVLKIALLPCDKNYIGRHEKVFEKRLYRIKKKKNNRSLKKCTHCKV